MTTRVLGADIYAHTFRESVDKIFGYLKSGKFHSVYTPNPEMLMLASKSAEFSAVLKRADLLLADGIGIVIAARRNKVKIPERSPGCDTIEALFPLMNNAKMSLYILGAAPGVAQKALERVAQKYPNIVAAGCGDGYFDDEKERIIIKEIQRLKPNLLLVGLGSPKQENFIHRHRKELPVSVAVGCGGTIDVLAGNVKRAPSVFRKLGLEWLCRLLSQPSRAGRMLQIPVFLIKVLMTNDEKG
ncbi:N-acetylmannosaminyltransferase [Clostridia bacterium]|nr:N-acetylmannosaminyltransferase [Clostridia bacterium]